MSFTKAIESCFNNYFTFRGRAPRSEYNYWLLFQFLLGGSLAVVLIIVSGNNMNDSEIDNYGSLFSLVLAPASISVIIRRFHDTGRSGWNWFWVITIIGAPVVIYWLVFMKGEQGANKYGSNPLSSNNAGNTNSTTVSTSNQSEQNVPSDDEKKPKAKKESSSYKKGGLYD